MPGRAGCSTRSTSGRSLNHRASVSAVSRIAAEPEPLKSRMRVTHGMLLNVVARPGNPFEAMRRLLDSAWGTSQMLARADTLNAVRKAVPHDAVLRLFAPELELNPERLARWAFVGGSPLKGETIETFGKSVLSAGAGLSNRMPEEIVRKVEAYLYSTPVSEGKLLRPHRLVIFRDVVAGDGQGHGAARAQPPLGQRLRRRALPAPHPRHQLGIGLAGHSPSRRRRGGKC